MSEKKQENKNPAYLHGYNESEQNRLYEQAQYLEQLIYNEIDFTDVKYLLEVGSGVGAQSEILLRRFPKLYLTGIEHSEKQLQRANSFLDKLPYTKGRFELLEMNAADMNLPSSDHFDGAFICWLLEHVPQPLKVLSEVRRVLRKGSPVVVNEVLNNTFFVEPYSPAVLKYWMRFNDFQYDMQGDPFVGAKLGNMLQSLGYTNIRTMVKTLHFDNRKPAKRARMIKFWTDLLLSGAQNLIDNGYIEKEEVEKVKAEMHIVAKDPNAVFFYSFIQAQALT